MNRTKSPSSSDSSKLLLDGEITLYHLDTAKNTGIWQCRFKNPLGKKPRYIRKSLKTKNVDIATKKAMELYTEYNTRAHLGLVRGKMTIADIWNECSHHMGRVWRRSGKELLELEWGGYFGDKDVTTITDADMHAYFEHRIKSLLASRQNDGDVGQRKWIASETTVNLSTLQWELRLLRSLFRKAYNQKVSTKAPHV